MPVHDPPLTHGTLHAPYFLFLRGDPPLEDRDLLRRLDMKEPQPHPLGAHPGKGSWVYLGEQGDWFMIADDWFYTFWHRADRRQVLEALARRWELFALRWPDVDESYEFTWFRDGALRRERIVDSPHYTDRIVTVDVGEPLPCETPALYEADGAEIVWIVAASLGIPRRHRKDTLRVYTYRPPWR
ncbi:MAG: hypothetical protein H6741_00245 [Alphaproteobacteria bacterium]|nr:hypothetical protein [Alphaproteobacteria bacterium]MCB9791134.1 hypothetical protein [Alphaproteobacteria bacterium]